MVAIVNTRRTAAEQAANVAKGVSWVTHSKHQDGLAIDIAPYAMWEQHGANKLNWDGTDPVWQQIGHIGEALGLRWGGHFRDYGHFEYVTPVPTHAA
jgi:D-alanyl-D-alanine carboxypeptidase